MKSLNNILDCLKLTPYVVSNFGLCTKIVREGSILFYKDNAQILVDDSFISSCFFYTEKDGVISQLKGRGRNNYSRLSQDVKGVFLVEPSVKEVEIIAKLEKTKEIRAINLNFDYDRIITELGLKGFEPNGRLMIIEFNVTIDNICICPAVEI
jgi:hypothetical protein